MKLSFIAWVGCGCLWGCGADDAGTDETATSGTTPVLDQPTPGAGDPTSSGNVENTPAPSGSPSANPSPSGTPTVQPSDTGTTPAPAPAGTNPFAPGTPETLIDGLDFPGRMATDGVNLYIANRRHFQADPSPIVEQGAPQAEVPLDQLLVWPSSAAAGDAPVEPKVLLEHPDVSGIAVMTDQLLVASMKAREFAVYDKATGELRTASNVPTTTGTPYQVAVSGERYFFGMASATGAAFITGTPGVPAELVTTDVSGSPMWMVASGPMLYASIGGEGGSSVLALDSESSEQRILARTVGWAGGLALHGDALLFTDYDANRLDRIELNSLTQTTVAEISQPWGLAVDGDYAYVSTQPDFCRATPEGSVQRVSLADGTTTQLTAAVSCPSMLLVVGDWLYWLNNGQVDDSSGLGVRSLGTGSLARLRRP